MDLGRWMCVGLKMCSKDLSGTVHGKPKQQAAGITSWATVEKLRRMDFESCRTRTTTTNVGVDT